MGFCYIIILGTLSKSLCVIYFLALNFPFSSHVLHEDVLERYLIDENKLYTKRVLVKKGFGHIPFWLRKILSNRQELIMEESIIDLEKKEILTSTRNFGGLSNYAVRNHLRSICFYSYTLINSEYFRPHLIKFSIFIWSGSFS